MGVDNQPQQRRSLGEVILGIPPLSWIVAIIGIGGFIRETDRLQGAKARDDMRKIYQEGVTAQIAEEKHHKN